MSAKQQPPCCPPTALPPRSAAGAGASRPLRGAWTAVGVVAGESVEAYVVEPQPGRGNGAAVVVSHDIFGPNSARTLHIADDLADKGYVVVVPNYWGKDVGEGLDDEWDFWPPWRLFTGQGGKMVRRARYPWAKVEAKLTGAVVPFIKSKLGDARASEPQHEPRIGMVGFCYGGWVVLRSLGLPGRPFACGVGAHPSVLNQRVQTEGPTLEEYFRAVQAPFFLAPGRGDPGSLRENGYWTNLLQSQPASRGSYAVSYPLAHGFANRGDVRDPAVRHVVDKWFNETVRFFNEHLLLGGGASTGAKL